MVKDIRNIGLVAGIELEARDKKTNTLGRDVFEECYKNGVMVRYTGKYYCIIASLIIEKNQIDNDI